MVKNENEQCQENVNFEICTVSWHRLDFLVFLTPKYYQVLDINFFL